MIRTDISLRPPTTSHLPQPESAPSPSTEWLTRTWHVVHSTLPMWKTKRNVTIQYTHVDGPQLKLDDIVSYQTLTSDKVKTVNGIDTASGQDASNWDWRGKGWLKVVASHWEVLGWGDLENGDQWAVTYFAKTVFTPAGIDVYSSSKEGVPDDILEKIQVALLVIDDADVKNLAGEMFEVKRD